METRPTINLTTSSSSAENVTCERMEDFGNFESSQSLISPSLFPQDGAIGKTHLTESAMPARSVDTASESHARARNSSISVAENRAEDADSTQARWPVKPYYEQDGIVIFHSDCREILPRLPNCDLILTDPPYGIGEAAGKNKSRTNKAVARDYGDDSWDNAIPDEWLFGLMRSKSQNQIIFGGNYFPLPPSPCWLVWDKLNSGDFADCELAWTNLDKAVRKIQWMWNGMLRQGNEDRFHPTQKPLGVISWALSQVPDAKSVIDPFMGSGTTLVACKKAGIACIGIEQSEKYCEIAAKRLAQSVLPLEVA